MDGIKRKNKEHRNDEVERGAFTKSEGKSIDQGRRCKDTREETYPWLYLVRISHPGLCVISIVRPKEFLRVGAPFQLIKSSASGPEII